MGYYIIDRKPGFDLLDLMLKQKIWYESCYAFARTHSDQRDPLIIVDKRFFSGIIKGISFSNGFRKTGWNKVVEENGNSYFRPSEQSDAIGPFQSINQSPIHHSAINSIIGLSEIFASAYSPPNLYRRGNVVLAEINERWVDVSPRIATELCRIDELTFNTLILT